MLCCFKIFLDAMDLVRRVLNACKFANKGRRRQNILVTRYYVTLFVYQRPENSILRISDRPIVASTEFCASAVPIDGYSETL